MARLNSSAKAVLCVMLGLAPTMGMAFQASPPPAQAGVTPAAGAPQADFGQGDAGIARRGTRLRVMIVDEVTTKTAKPGDKFKIALELPVVVGDRVIIPRGVTGAGEVVSAAESGIAGKSGKLATRLLYLDVNGRRVALDTSSKANSGQGGNLQIVLATAALTPWGLVARGNNAKLKAGEVVDAILAEDVSASPPRSAAIAPQPAPEAVAATAAAPAVDPAQSDAASAPRATVPLPH